MKKLTLVLGGGAVKGFAHIGVIEELEKSGIRPSLIVGCSMGSIIGGAYAKGLSIDEIKALANKFRLSKISDFSLKSMLKNGNLMKGKKLKKFLLSVFGTSRQENSNIPFCCVATDMDAGKLIVLDKGFIWQNVMASSAMPAVFPEVKINGRNLNDGGVLSNVPVKLAKKLAPNSVIVSIDVIGEYPKQIEMNGGLKMMNKILNMTTLYSSQIVEKEKKLADLNINITQPTIRQLDSRKESVEKAIENGRVAIQPKLKEIINLLNEE